MIVGNRIDQILSLTYGFDRITTPPLNLIWAAWMASDELGMEPVREMIDEINSARKEQGEIPIFWY